MERRKERRKKCGGKHGPCPVHFQLVVGHIDRKGEMPRKLTATGECAAVNDSEYEKLLKELE
jgi:hypothetical protein